MLTKKEIVDILKDDSQNKELFELADKVRHDNVGDEIHLRGLIEFSNTCKCTCHYCGLRAENKTVERYRITPDDIIQFAKNAVNAGYKTIVLQSGEDVFYSKDIMCKIISEIKKLDVALTLSIGEKPYKELEAYKNAGADRYLLRIETTDKKLYKALHPFMSFENRKNCLYNLKKLGYKTGSGCLVGLPGQTIESLADDILFFKENDFDMIGIGPFIAHPDTPLKNAPNGSLILALKVMSIIRILMKDINIPATTAMETLNPKGRIMALQSGANVIMPNVTMSKYRKKYEIYPNKTCTNEEIDKYKNYIETKIKSINRTISKDFGFRNI